MKRKLFLLLPLLTAVVFELIYFFIYKHFNIYREELLYNFLINFSLFAEFIAFLGCYLFLFATEKISRQTRTITTIILIAFTAQPFVTFVGIVCVVIAIGFCKVLKDISGYIKNPMDEKI